MVRNLSLNFNFNIRLATGESFDTPISISDEEIANNFGKFTIDTNKISPRLFSPYDENVTEKL
ncbi:MAG: hypothetical protein K2L48_03495 [Mycoplasmoidaceae bacterium]|nr:hypothetical protein [Mycoplasmoidaceae bacterium]